MTHQVVVVGVGYAGLVAAEQLARRVKREATVTLVTEEPMFRERPRFHQLATGQNIRELDLRKLLASSGVRLRLAQVEQIDAEGRRLKLRDSTDEMPYDMLVYCCGSRSVIDGLPGLAEHAQTLDNPEQLRQLAKRLASSAEGTQVAVIGGGLTGIETATEIAESSPKVRVTLVSESEPGGHLSPRARLYLAKRFAQLNVTVIPKTGVASVDRYGLLLANGAMIPADIVVAAVGFAPSDLGERSGLPVDTRGRVRVDRSLKVIDSANIYAAGDACAAPGPWGDSLAMGCRTGGFMGPAVAKSVQAALHGRPAPEFKYRYIHECISLGRKKGVVQFLHADERPRKSSLRGRKAMRYKNATLKAAILQIRIEAKRSRHKSEGAPSDYPKPVVTAVKQ